MLNIIVNGADIKSTHDLYPPFRKRFDDLYGSNLDALHDVISYNRYNDFIVTIYNEASLIDTLGQAYYSKFLEILSGNKVIYFIK